MSSSMATHSAASAPILAEIREQIQQLFLTPLSDNNMQVMQEKVQILHRSSFYLEELSYPIEPQQLPGALRVAQSHVRLPLESDEDVIGGDLLLSSGPARLPAADSDGSSGQ
ncbi:uncharacterized protein LOC110153712 [Boleophthalmus pectinirostris]|uniref:uncharacterized protein LOC110153712 n=1 Tax=Boleophthalmus pectinirostris TaxID=150288 RepID=UPI00242C8828|nr:uncharacterized protein LOC110153712 [Boleophthalmus pectinirostris]